MTVVTYVRSCGAFRGAFCVVFALHWNLKEKVRDIIEIFQEEVKFLTKTFCLSIHLIIKACLASSYYSKLHFLSTFIL